MTKEVLSLQDVVSECTAIITPSAEQKDISFSVDLSKGHPAIHANRRALTQILLNILSNAIKFTPTGGQVTFTATASNDHHVLTISDTGEGVAESKLSSLTEPFVMIRNDPYNAEEGTGLGLAIVKSLVELHDGDLDIKSTLGEGMTVTITLPGHTS